MRVLVHNTRADLATLYDFKNHPRLGCSQNLASHIVPLVSFLTGIVTLLVRHWRSFPLPYLAFASGIIFVLVLLLGLRMRQILRSLYMTNATPEKYESFALSLNEGGLTIEQNDEELFLPWSQFREVRREGNYLFLLGVGETPHDFALPDRSFPSRLEAQTFSKESRTFWLQSRPDHKPIALPQ